LSAALKSLEKARIKRKNAPYMELQKRLKKFTFPGDTLPLYFERKFRELTSDTT